MWPRSVTRTPVSLGDHTVGERRAADRDHHQVGLDRLSVTEAHGGGAARRRGVTADRDAGAHVDALLLEGLKDDLGHVLVAARQDLGQRLEDGHRGAQVGQGWARTRSRSLPADDDGTIRDARDVENRRRSRPARQLEAGDDQHRARGEDDGVAGERDRLVTAGDGHRPGRRRGWRCRRGS